MGQPAARVGDLHTCPMVTPGLPPIPHVGGPVLPPGVINVLIGGMPAATVGTMCFCVGPPDMIVRGSATVLIGGQPTARMGDSTAHGGIITMGCPTVLIGDVGISSIGNILAVLPQNVVLKVLGGISPMIARTIAQIATVTKAAQNGTPFCEKC